MRVDGEDDGRTGHAPSHGLARILYELDIEEFDRKFQQQCVLCEGQGRAER